ncbi:MAG TPA: hypothetical protein VH352_22280 [Pseudonocardiaceae bacterium]|nr:hypothetical protein [Pseudonocardiaceae bacterium]
MHSNWARLAVATALAAAVTAGSAMAGVGTADAATPILVGSCATSVQGAPGTPVELSPVAVMQPVVNLVNGLSLGLLGGTFQSAFATMPPIPLGALPTGSGTISGGQIANAVVAQLNGIPLLGPILGGVVGQVQSMLANMCSIGVTGVNAVVAPVQDGTATISQAGQQAGQALGITPKGSTSPGTGGTPGQTGTPPGGTPQQGGGSGGTASGLPPANSPVLGGLPGLGSGGSLFNGGNLLDFGLAESPLARYAGIPFASAGLFDPSPGVKYGGDVTGYAPQFGVLGQSDKVQPDGVQTAGQAEAYNAGGGPLGSGVGLPMLLAVLMLAGVTAALVRTWVLRRLPT